MKAKEIILNIRSNDSETDTVLLQVGKQLLSNLRGENREALSNVWRNGTTYTALGGWKLVRQCSYISCATRCKVKFAWTSRDEEGKGQLLDSILASQEISISIGKVQKIPVQ